MKTIKLIFIIVILFTNILTAQNKQQVKNIGDYYLDFPIPDLSAYTLLGINPNSVTRPGNVKEFTASLLNVVSSGSKISPGIAIEWTPYITFTKLSTENIDEYKKNILLRRLQLSFGSNQDTLGSKVAYGLKWTIIDDSDPLLDSFYQKSLINVLNKKMENSSLSGDKIAKYNDYFYNPLCKDISSKYNISNEKINDAINKLVALDSIDECNIKISERDELIKECTKSINKVINGDISKDTTGLLENLYKVVDKYISILLEAKNFDPEVYYEEIRDIKKKFKNDNWNKSSLMIGFGQVLNSSDNSWTKLSSNKISGFINSSFPLCRFDESAIQLLSQFVFDNYFGNDKLKRELSTSLGGRVLYGTNDFRLSFEGKFSYLKYKETVEENIKRNLRVTAGFEIKIEEGIWFELAIGADGDLCKDWIKPDFISLGNLKYSINKEKRKLD